MPNAHQETPDVLDVLDVLIIGAGLSGIGAAVQLQRRCPAKRYAILDGRAASGGTWDLFRYPGVRSDSDMHTLAYRFKPWTSAQAIVDGATILDYLRAAAEENGVAPHIRLRHTVRSASWSSAEACWTVLADAGTDAGTGSVPVALRTRFLYCCTGYYSYDTPYRPAFPGEEQFEGVCVLPQFWPQDLDCAGRRIVVIGSGATAVTLVPALARTAAHVTMLQRTPSFILALPARDRLAQWAQAVLPQRAAFAAIRWKNVALGTLFHAASRRWPAPVARLLTRRAARSAGALHAAPDFTPPYRPWDQRLCVAPDGDLFAALRSGRASIVTDSVAGFTGHGIALASGRQIDADIVVLATGLSMKILGGIALAIDGKRFDPAAAMAYKGMMLSDLPNCAMAFSYTNASWTLKADLTAHYVCRLLAFMDRKGVQIAVPRREAGVAARPFLDFTSGYVARARHLLPAQGTRKPWRVAQNYLRDLATIRYGRIDDGVMAFGTARDMK